MGRIFILLFSFVLLVLVIVRWQNRQYDSFLENSDKISGVIIGKEERAVRNDQPQRKEHLVSYSYRVDNKEYIGRENVEFTDLWLDIKEGQTVDINYLRTDPANSHLSMLLNRRVKSTNF
jgi:hypothetical protein